MKRTPGHVLPVIVIAQFLCTSLWFAGNAIIGDLQQELGLDADAIGHITSAVQLGFIAGTLTFAFFSIADRYSPSKVFFLSALAGSIANYAIVWYHDTNIEILIFRFLAGFFLAGIYPVGMKIAADYHARGLGKALGFLVGALTLGTAFPHLVRVFSLGWSWKAVLVVTSACAVAGGLMVLLLVSDGPHRKPAITLDFKAVFRVFAKRDFRAAAFGYFGHMWELFAFWAFLPVILSSQLNWEITSQTVSFWTFAIIAVGGLSCVAGGYAARGFGSARVAVIALICSGLCCFVSPLLKDVPAAFFLAALLFWGMAVVADSPQFSALVARTAPDENVGTAFTIVNCIGFAITIVSIQLVNTLNGAIPDQWLLFPLVAGPALGVLAMRRIW